MDIFTFINVSDIEDDGTLFSSSLSADSESSTNANPILRVNEGSAACSDSESCIPMDFERRGAIASNVWCIIA